MTLKLAAIKRTSVEMLRGLNGFPIHFVALGLASIALFLSVPVPVRAEVSNMRGIAPAVSSCWTPPQGSENLQATVRFMLRRDGSLIGKPSITFSQLGKDEDLNRAFIASILAAFAKCTPIVLSPGFGGVVAGQLIWIRFKSSLPATSV